MNLLEASIDELMKTHIFEIAFQRKHIINKTRDLSVQIASHVAKIALWPDYQARNHWESELHHLCKDISQMSYDRSKKLTKDDYHKLLYKEPYENTDFVDNEAKTSIRVDKMPDHKWSNEHKQNLEGKIKGVYNDLSNQLSSNNYEHISDTLKNNGL